MNKITTDIAIIGGGIAGIWTMHRLQKLGYSVVLFEKDKLGCEQTIKSQGIIHGGLKYALNGAPNSAQDALSNMPTRWHKCLDGSGEMDLSDVKVLSTHQYMWSTNALAGSLATLFASKALSSHVSQEPTIPDILHNSNIKSKLYKLSEMVLDIPSLLNSLASPNCLQIKFDQNLDITAQKFIYTAGKSNNHQQQLRPLHMVVVKSPSLAPLYGHCIALGTVPRITITTHIASDGNLVWYLGGKLAEDGVNLDSAMQIAQAKQELQAILPNVDLKNAKWASFLVDRAEEKQANRSKPDNVSIINSGDDLIAWPTKLALAPVLADKICNILRAEKIQPRYAKPDLANLPIAKVATPIWDEIL